MDFQSAKSFGKLRLRAFQPYYKYYICQYCRYKTRSLMHSMLSMLTLSTQFSHLIVLCIRCCVRATNTSVNSVDKHSIKCIACFDLHINSVNKQDTLLNIQWHCFDLLYRPSRHAFMSIRTTMQILIQSLRITVKFNLNPWFTVNYNRVRIKTSN